MAGCSHEVFLVAIQHIKNIKASENIVEEEKKEKNENITRAREKEEEEIEIVKVDEKKETAGVESGLSLAVL